MFGQDFLHKALIGAPIILFSLTVHEFFHAWSAFRFGDTTARDQGRLTLNPLAHLDLTGVLVMVVSQFRFGWARPVPVNPLNLRNPRVANLWISAAGPLSNVGLAVIAGLVYRSVLVLDLALPPMFIEFLTTAVAINIILAFFNLVPLFPLDGSHILKSLVGYDVAARIERFDRFAPFVLILLVITGVLWIFLWPPVAVIISLILGQ